MTYEENMSEAKELMSEFRVAAQRFQEHGTRSHYDAMKQKEQRLESWIGNLARSKRAEQ